MTETRRQRLWLLGASAVVVAAIVVIVIAIGRAGGGTAGTTTGTPEGIAALLAKMEQIEPWMTPEEDAEWRKALAAQKEWDKAHWDEEGEKMRKAFE